MHTTTFAEMFELPLGGDIVDTPGIRELGIVDIPKAELSHYFPEMRRVLSDCRYHNCLHIQEPECAVKEAVNQGTISYFRYGNYLSIMDTMTEKNY